MRKDTPKYVKEISKELRKNQTEAEQLLWKELRSSKLKGYKFKRQYPIGRYIAEFYCSSVRLAIEIDGEIHNNIEQKEYDTIREKEIKSREINILRFSNEEIFVKINDVLLDIKDVIKKLSSKDLLA